MNPNAVRVCAYCLRAGDFTREHLYPRFLYNYSTPAGKVLGYNGAADKVTVGERVIGDVCAVCNNGVLSQLDSYGREYCDQNNAARPVDIGSLNDVSYSYDNLLRWVLKVCYNSARTIRDAEVKHFMPHLPYIVTGQRTCEAENLELWLELIGNHQLTEAERERMTEPYRTTGIIPCYFLASGRATNVGRFGLAALHHFQVNSHRFHLLFWSPETTGRKEPSGSINFMPRAAIRLDPSSPKALGLRALRDVLEIHSGPQVHAKERAAEASYYKKTERPR